MEYYKKKLKIIKFKINNKIFKMNKTRRMR